MNEFQVESVGITGSNGFVGSHLKWYLKYNFPQVRIIEFNRSEFEDPKAFSGKLKECGSLVHLAAVNRETETHKFSDNVDMAEFISGCLLEAKNKIRLIYSSSIHAVDPKTSYGDTKRQASELMSQAARRSGSDFCELIIPNVFGEFCKPNYNSVVATFSQNTLDDIENTIIEDKQITLIHVQNLARKISSVLLHPSPDLPKKVVIEGDTQKSVSELDSDIRSFYKRYFLNREVPRLESGFDVDLFNTFRSYIPCQKLLYEFKRYEDDRGKLSEIVKCSSGGQAFYSTTKPGIVRGNHFHFKKFERFVVLAGEARISIRSIASEEVVHFDVSGDIATCVDMPTFHTHNIENIGEGDLVTIFWTNEHFNPEKPDTYKETV